MNYYLNHNGEKRHYRYVRVFARNRFSIHGKQSREDIKEFIRGKRIVKQERDKAKTNERN